MKLPSDLLLSDLLKRHVRSPIGAEGLGVRVWIHPLSHRVLGWVTHPSPFNSQYTVWRLNQLHSFNQQEVLVYGHGIEIDSTLLQQLPTIINASLMNSYNQQLGTVADVIIRLETGDVHAYLIARSNPDIPGSSRWALPSHLIVRQYRYQVFTEIQNLQDLPLIRSSIRQNLISKSNHLHRQIQMMNNRTREQIDSILHASSWKQQGFLRSQKFTNSLLEENDIESIEIQQKDDSKVQNHSTTFSILQDSDCESDLDEDLWI